MITAVDTNILLDIFTLSDQHGSQSKAWLGAAYNAGAIVISDVVYNESNHAEDLARRLSERLGWTYVAREALEVGSP